MPFDSRGREPRSRSAEVVRRLANPDPEKGHLLSLNRPKAARWHQNAMFMPRKPRFGGLWLPHAMYFVEIQDLADRQGGDNFKPIVVFHREAPPELPVPPQYCLAQGTASLPGAI